MNDLLLDCPPVLSPRLRWMAQHGILTHESWNCPEAPWIALIPFDEDKGKPIDECMADNCRLYDEGGFLGYGMTEDEAIVDLAKRRGLLLWNEQSPASPMENAISEPLTASASETSGTGVVGDNCSAEAAELRRLRE